MGSSCCACRWSDNPLAPQMQSGADREPCRQPTNKHETKVHRQPKGHLCLIRQSEGQDVEGKARHLIRRADQNHGRHIVEKVDRNGRSQRAGPRRQIRHQKPENRRPKRDGRGIAARTFGVIVAEAKQDRGCCQPDDRRAKSCRQLLLEIAPKEHLFGSGLKQNGQQSEWQQQHPTARVHVPLDRVAEIIRRQDRHHDKQDHHGHAYGQKLPNHEAHWPDQCQRPAFVDHHADQSGGNSQQAKLAQQDQHPSGRLPVPRTARDTLRGFRFHQTKEGAKENLAEHQENARRQHEPQGQPPELRIIPRRCHQLFMCAIIQCPDRHASNGGCGGPSS
mmetsp:Transcript_23022/g.38982  ORF Transcript_23022/g.38982 Transcript_23022/m.38982 type:complete len:334 (+) Transcript_23022:4550-5551(+)